MEAEFQIGDKVQLLRGGPVMTVYELGEKFIRVGWIMSQDRQAKVWISPSVLKPV
jgi:uncharacterized protein YodC (DUF2158 family)